MVPLPKTVLANLVAAPLLVWGSQSWLSRWRCAPFKGMKAPPGLMACFQGDTVGLSTVPPAFSSWTPCGDAMNQKLEFVWRGLFWW